MPAAEPGTLFHSWVVALRLFPVPTAEAPSCRTSSLQFDVCAGWLHCACREVRDPRFESLSGQYNEERFKRRYAFLYDDKLPQERKELKANMQKVGAGQLAGRVMLVNVGPGISDAVDSRAAAAVNGGLPCQRLFMPR